MLEKGNMHKFILFLLPSLLIGTPNLYDKGKKLYFSKGCNGCHGISASGTSEYPSLAHRRKAFLEYKLKRYRSKQSDTQQAELMIPFAMKLSDQEIDALTTFFEQYKEGKSQYKMEFSNRGDGGS